MISENLLSVENLSWSVDQRSILKGISFSIEQGDFVGLIGPNGAGKSSLMRCLYRVNKPTSGQVLFNQKDIWELSAKASARNIGVILQEHNGHVGLTVKDVVGLGLTPHKKLFELDTQADQNRMLQILNDLDLLPLQQALFTRLSGGEKQRVMLARAMLQNPELLIMDEPTNHLDVHYQIDLLRKVKALKKTVLASFHDLNLAAAYCDSLLVLDKGELIAMGKPAEVLTEDLISQTFNACVVVDSHPLYKHPRISYAYHADD